MNAIRAKVQAELPALRAIRHDLHRHPELAFQESRTSQVVQRELAAMGISFKAGLAKGTGVVAHLPATGPIDPADARPAIALRADMDALPIVEATGKPYASQNPGVMHACGHDGHTTILLGAARVLSALPRPRPVTLVFQPAEEGGGGGDLMVKDGALDGAAGGGLGPPVGRIFGLHGWPTIPVGIVASKPGPLLASTDDFTITVKGVQSHGAYPHFGRDPIVAMAQVILGLQTIASRNVSPLDSVVVTVGAVHGGTADNIIPESITCIGTVRTLRAETKKFAKERLYAVTEGICAALGCEAQIAWHEGYPVTENDPEATERFFAVARSALGAERVRVVPEPTMGGEDFSYYGKKVPACFFLLGLCPQGAASCPTIHQPDFDFNDDALPIGIEMMVELATRG